jgi:hypothetical protein
MKKRFQSLSFKCNLHRYSEGSTALVTVALTLVTLVGLSWLSSAVG